MTGASKLVLRDWCVGKIRWYTTPPSSAGAASSAPDDWLQSLYVTADGILTNLETRKNMRKAGGLVKLSPGQVECRKVSMGSLYADVEDSSDDEYY